MAEHNDIALETARRGIVLLKNDGVLLLAADTTARIAAIGGHAQVGVPTGTGSSAVVPPGGHAVVIKIGGPFRRSGSFAQPLPPPVVGVRMWSSSLEFAWRAKASTSPI
jgi:beta-glucosidase-like glycosyl hydrolase